MRLQREKNNSRQNISKAENTMSVLANKKQNNKLHINTLKVKDIMSVLAKHKKTLQKHFKGKTICQVWPNKNKAWQK
jgi:tRNA pseudouridine-54 N-methylase